MKCPRCHGELKTIQYEGVEIETCPGCGGEWLDKNELSAIVQKEEEKFSDNLRESLDAINKNIFTVDESLDNKLMCPKCDGVELNRFNYASSTGVVLDKCPECGGIWLDKDEIESVQVLVEEWKAKLDEDLDKFAPMLDRLEAEAKAKDKSAVSVSRFGFVNAILRGLMDKIGY